MWLSVAAYTLAIPGAALERTLPLLSLVLYIASGFSITAWTYFTFVSFRRHIPLALRLCCLLVGLLSAASLVEHTAAVIAVL